MCMYMYIGYQYTYMYAPTTTFHYTCVHRPSVCMMFLYTLVDEAKEANGICSAYEWVELITKILVNLTAVFIIKRFG